MQAIDYNALLDESSFARRERLLAQRAIPIDELYRSCNGVQYVSREGSPHYFHEIARLADDAFLLSTDLANASAAHINQIVQRGDWVHIQFRLNGGAYEKCGTDRAIDTPAGSCVVARYPDNSLIERGISLSDRSRYACLFMKPAAVAALLDASTSDLPSSSAWIAADGHRELQIKLLPLQSTMSLAVTDIMKCPFRGSARRAYMRAKSIELLSAVIHGLNSAEQQALRSHEKLSTSDLMKISQARTIISKGLPQTLDVLARRVGLNRSKLAYGFKHVYGVPVHQYWREANLERAYRLLHEGEASVAVVAATLGYLDPSSFTRAFNRKYGVLPKKCKG